MCIFVALPPSRKIRSEKKQNFYDFLVVGVFTPAVDVNFLQNMAHKTILDVQRDYRRYHSKVDDSGGSPKDFSAEFVNDLDDIVFREVGKLVVDLLFPL